MAPLVDLAREHGGSILWRDALVALRDAVELPADHDVVFGAWFASLCDAVAERHEGGEVVGDLDSGRVALVVDGEGLTARLVERDGSRPSAVHRSPARLDPDHEPVAADDVYALGAILYEGLALRAPFTAHGRAPLDVEIRRGVPPDPRRLRPAASPGLALVAQQALARRPARRHADVRALAEDVRAVLDGRGPSARGPSLVARGWAALRREPGRVLAQGFVAVGLLGSLGLAAWTTTLVRDAEERASEARDLAEARERVAEERLAAAERHRAEAEAAVERWRTASEAERVAREEQERARLAAAEAEQSASLERERRARAAWDSYVTTLKSAETAFATGDAAEARALLERCPAEWRGWMWDHLAWRLDPSSSWSLPGPSGASWSAHVAEAGVVAWADDTLVVARADGGARRLDLPDDVGAVTCARWLPADDAVDADLVVGDDAGTLHLLRVSDDPPARTARWPGGTSPVTSLAAHVATPGARHVVSGHADGTLVVRSLADGAVRHVCRMDDATSPVTALALSPSGDRIAATSARGVVLWDAGSGLALDVFTADVGAAAFAPDGRHLVLATDERLELWDARRGDRVAARDLPGGSAVAFVDGGTGLLLGDAAGAWRDVDLPRLAAGAVVPGHVAPIVALGEGDDARVVSVAADGVVRVASRALRGPCAVELGGPSQRLAVAGDRLVVTSAAGDVALLDAQRGHVLVKRPAQAAAALDAAATTLVSIDRVGVARLWSARSGEPLGEVPLAVGRVEALAVAPESFGGAESSVRTLAIATIALDGKRGVQVLAVDAVGGKVEVLGRFDVHAVPTSSLDFGVDGTLVRRTWDERPERWRWVDGEIVADTTTQLDDPRRRVTRDDLRRVVLAGDVVELRDRAEGVVLARFAASAPIVDVAITDEDTIVTLDETGRVDARHRALDRAVAWCRGAWLRRDVTPFVASLAAEGLARDEALERVASEEFLDDERRAAARSLVVSGWAVLGE